MNAVLSSGLGAIKGWFGKKDERGGELPVRAHVSVVVSARCG